MLKTAKSRPAPAKRKLNRRSSKMHRHKNRDGSLGGYVAKTARVHPEAIIESGAIVMPKAVVASNVTIRSNQIVVPDGTVLTMPGVL